MMIFVNSCYKENVFPLEYAKGFLKLFNPIAPHITEELWSIITNTNSTMAYESWPEFDENKTIDNEIELPIQLNGKLKSTIKVALNTSEDVIKEAVHKHCKELLKDKNIVKEIYVPNKIYNIVVK